MNGEKLYTDVVFSDKAIKFSIPSVTIKKVTPKGKKLTLKWKKVKNVSGYVIYLQKANGKYKAVKTIKNNKTFKYVYGKFSAKKYKAVKIKAYVLYNGKKYF